MSATPDSTLADPQQIIADLQRQLAGCRAERDEALQVINSSPGDLSPVFEAMLEKATRLSDGVAGVLWIIDGARVKVGATHGRAAEFIELLREYERPEVGPAWPMRQIMGGERVVQIANVREHNIFQTGDPVTRLGWSRNTLGPSS